MKLLVFLMTMVTTANCYQGTVSEVPWDQCQSPQKGIFCIGGKDGEAATHSGQGCLVTKDCQVLIFGDLGTPTDNSVRWLVYFASTNTTKLNFFLASTQTKLAEGEPLHTIFLHADEEHRSCLVKYKNEEYDVSGLDLAYHFGESKFAFNDPATNHQYSACYFTSPSIIDFRPPSSTMPSYSIDMQKGELFPYVFHQVGDKVANFIQVSEPIKVFENIPAIEVASSTIAETEANTDSSATTEVISPSPEPVTDGPVTDEPVTDGPVTNGPDTGSAAASKEKSSSFLWLWIALGILLLLGFAAAVAFMLVNRKKKSVTTVAVERGENVLPNGNLQKISRTTTTTKSGVGVTTPRSSLNVKI